MKRILSIAAIVGAILLIGTAYGMIAGSPSQASADEAVVTAEQPSAKAENQPNDQTASNEAANQKSSGLTPTKVSAAEAIALAEKAYSGTATEMDRDIDNGIVHYDIEIVSAQNQSKDVIVDATTGKVTFEQDNEEDSEDD
jgi:uncharacterized membrane protein YkoI